MGKLYKRTEPVLRKKGGKDMLTVRQAEENQKKYGFNELAEAKKKGILWEG